MSQNLENANGTDPEPNPSKTPGDNVMRPFWSTDRACVAERPSTARNRSSGAKLDAVLARLRAAQAT